jgi:hypothetical protein
MKIWPNFVYECESLRLILREEYSLKVFDRKILGQRGRNEENCITDSVLDFNYHQRLFG